MSSIDQRLGPNERIKHQAHYPFSTLFPAAFVGLWGIAIPVFAAMSMDAPIVLMLEELGVPAALVLLVGGVIGGAGLFLFALREGVGQLIAIFTSEFVVTTERVVMKTGWRRKSFEFQLLEIKTVKLRQRWIGELFNVGSVDIGRSSNWSDVSVALVNPRAFHQSVIWERSLAEGPQRRAEIRERAKARFDRKIARLERTAWLADNDEVG